MGMLSLNFVEEFGGTDIVNVLCEFVALFCHIIKCISEISLEFILIPFG